MSFTTEGQFVPFPAPTLITITGAGTIAREGLADTDAPARAIWTAGRRVWCKGTVTGQTVDGNNVWLVTGKGESRDLSWRIWSGATDFETRAVVGRTGEDAMSETRDQFRERIGRMANEIFHEEVNDAAATIQEGGTLPPMFNFTGHGFECAAEAVYTQALRDVYQHAASLPLDMDQITVQEMVEAFAAERGINLEDTP